MDSGHSGLTSTLAPKPGAASRRKWLPTGIVLALTASLLAFGLFSQTANTASAASAPVAQCNNDTASNVGGQGIACTVTIDNYVTSAGAATAPSTVTLKVCTGAAGPIASGAGTCTTTTSAPAEPVTLVQQCDGSGNGGGGVVICTVTVTNHFSSSPTAAITAATVYQCIPLPPGGSCSPANTAGITSVPAATVGQCNGSGAGGTSVGFTCTVFGASGMTTTLPVNIDQCNGSGNGGGALVRCTATVTNQVAPPPTATATPPTATAPATTPTAIATAPATTPTGAVTSTATSTPTGAATVTATATAPSTPAATSTATAAAPSTPTPVVAPPSAPLPPATGNAGLAGSGGSSPAVLWMLGVAATLVALGLGLAGRMLVSRRRIR